jgi:hypothetical protein
MSTSLLYHAFGLKGVEKRKSITTQRTTTDLRILVYVFWPIAISDETLRSLFFRFFDWFQCVQKDNTPEDKNEYASRRDP